MIRYFRHRARNIGPKERTIIQSMINSTHRVDVIHVELIKSLAGCSINRSRVKRSMTKNYGEDFLRYYMVSLHQDRDNDDYRERPTENNWKLCLELYLSPNGSIRSITTLYDANGVSFFNNYSSSFWVPNPPASIDCGFVSRRIGRTTPVSSTSLHRMHRYSMPIFQVDFWRKKSVQHMAGNHRWSGYTCY